MAGFVTAEELERFGLTLGIYEFDAEQTARATQLLTDAKAVIESEEGAGQPLESSTDTVTLDGTGTHLLVLPRWPVTAITSVTVTEDDTDTLLTVGTDYEWSATGILTRVSGRWPTEPRSVAVVFTAGYADISPDLTRISRRLAAAGWHNPAGANSEQSGDRSVQWHVPGMQLTAAELRTVRRYGVGSR